MDLNPKYIIETDEELGDCLILSKCVYHKDLVTDKTKVKGGGWFRYNEHDRSFTFHGESFDFKRAKLEDVKKCVENDRVFTNKRLTHSIGAKFKFKYDIGSEIIPLN